jgi:hypothetical protein
MVASCAKPEDRPCFKSTGEMVEETRALSAFKNIVVSDNIELILTQTNATNATVISGKNLQNFIITEVKNDTLFIRNDNRCSVFRSYKSSITVDVSFNELNYIRTSSSKNISSNDSLRLDSLLIEGFNFYGDLNLVVNANYIACKAHSGGCKITVDGVAEESYGYHVGTGSIDYSSLKTKRTHFHSRTTTDCYLSPSNYLEVEIHSGGNVYYNAQLNPTIKLKKLGVGQLIPY